MSEQTTRYRMPGKPPKAPKNKLGVSIRCMITNGLNDALIEQAEKKGILISDLLRLALYNQLIKDGELTDELRRDATWDELRKQGLA